MDSSFLMLDVGGTGIKAGLFTGAGQMAGPVRHFKARAKESREIIFENFAGIIREMASGCRIDGIGMAFPGPFDYEQGISLMRGLDKYDDIYGLDIRKGVMERLSKEDDPVSRDCRFLFLHDVEAFALGVCSRGPISRCQKVFCVCIGTGAGSAFVKDGRIIREPGAGVPENGWIYCTPYKDGVIDDYVSVRGLGRLTEEVFARAEGMDGAALYKRAEAGDEGAKKVFSMFGEDVKEALWPFLSAFRPDGLVLGGQIAKSFPHFGKQLKEACRAYRTEIFLEPDTSVRAMEGLYAAWINTRKGFEE